ncbi:MAG: hypothetical protein HKN47_09595, partial [Pirellulaceae bacterium]|nr:hypothetical protein [Pirellulaceae bacterium]
MKRRQISLLNVVLLVTTAAAVMAWWSLYQRNRILMVQMEHSRAEIAMARAEHAKVKAEFGLLTIDDATQIHAVAVPGPKLERTWTYRVYLPRGRNYFAAVQLNSLPAAGEVPVVTKPPGYKTTKALGTNKMGVGLTPGEYVITLYVAPKADGKFHYQV